MPVYFIRAGETEMVKIGCAHTVQPRLENLRAAHYLPLHLLRVVPGKRGVEHWMHQRFADRRVHNEWFTYHPDMMTVTVPVDHIDYLNAEFEANKERIVAALNADDTVPYKKVADDLNIPIGRLCNWIAKLQSKHLVPRRLGDKA